MTTGNFLEGINHILMDIDSSTIAIFELFAMPYESCGFQIALLKQIGLWPLNRKSTILNVLQRLFLCFEMVSLFFASICLAAGTIFSKDLKNVSSSIDIMTLTASALYKTCFIVFNIEKFRNMVDFMRVKFKTIVYNIDGDFVSVKKENKRCSLYTILLVGSGDVVTLFYGLTPILEQKYEEPMPFHEQNSTRSSYPNYPLAFWIPFDTYWNPMFYIVFTLQTFVLILSAHIYLCMDSFFFMMIYQVRTQMIMLSKMWTHLGNKRMDFMEKNSAFLESVMKNSTQRDLTGREKVKNITPAAKIGDFNNEVVNAKLRKCIRFHSDLLRFMMEIEKIYRSMILADILHAIISLSFALHETGVSDSIFERVKMYSFVIVCIAHQLGNSLYGQMFLDAQTSIATATYNFPWYECDTRTRKHFVLILARSNKLTILNGGKMYYLRYQSFILFMKTIFSYFMVLRQVSS